eukprot:Gb_26188 [translate_table: standard]
MRNHDSIFGPASSFGDPSLFGPVHVRARVFSFNGFHRHHNGLHGNHNKGVHDYLLPQFLAATNSISASPTSPGAPASLFQHKNLAREGVLRCFCVAPDQAVCSLLGALLSTGMAAFFSKNTTPNNNSASAKPLSSANAKRCDIVSLPPALSTGFATFCEAFRADTNIYIKQPSNWNVSPSISAT